MVTVEELIDWLRAEAEDAELIEDLRDAAVTYVEEQTGMRFSETGEVVQTMGWYGWPLALRGEPLAGADFTLERWSGSAWEAVDSGNYYLDGAFVRPAGTWEMTEVTPRFRATYTTGYTAGLAPKPLQVAVRLLVAHWYENREPVNIGNIVNELPFAVDNILRLYRRVTV